MSFSTKQPTEAEFEAAISAVLQNAFPTLLATDLRHQLTFNIRLGRKTHLIESNSHDWAAGRCDVLITKDGKHLSMLELKRPGIGLTDDDRLQGLSYARLIEPWPPLVIVSNINETRIYETFSGKEWTPLDRDEAAVSYLFATSAALARSDLNNAIEVLLGSSKKCWISLVRSFSQEQIDHLTGEWDDLLSPFPKGLLLPRKATAVLRRCLETTDYVPFIIGPPLSGKSNVLREFVHSSASSNNIVTFYLDADSSGHGIFQTISNLMTQSLGWGFNPDLARTWLHRISKSEKSPTLVLMVDGGNPADLKPELDELVSGTYGPNLRLAVSIDRGATEQLLLSTSGRQRTKLGTKAAIIELQPLDDDEFELAAKVLYDRRFVFMHGSKRSPHHRVPWLLRSFVAVFKNAPEYLNEELAAAIPSVPGMQPLAFAEQRFGEDATLKGQYLGYARAVLEDIETNSSSLELSLLRTSSYACQLDTLRRTLGETEISALVSKGYLKHHIIGTDRVVVAQLPVFVAFCASELLAERLASGVPGNHQERTDQLIKICGKMAFGEVVGAVALHKSVVITRQLPEAVLSRLLACEPKRQSLPPGTKAVTTVNGMRIEFEIVDERHFIAIFPDGERIEIESPLGESPPRTQSDMTSWLILSHFGQIPFLAVNSETNEALGRIDATILREVGSCKVVLKRPESDMPDQITVHELDDETVTVCHQEGIIEPITFSLYTAMTRERQFAEMLIDESIKRQSLPFLSRINIALLQIEQQSVAEKSEWASQRRNDEILPMFRNTLLEHERTNPADDVPLAD